MSSTIQLEKGGLTLEALNQIVVEHAPIALSDAALAEVQRSYDFLVAFSQDKLI